MKKNEINIYHFSDLHISKIANNAIVSLDDINNNEENYVAIKNAINKEINKTDNNYLIISGDIVDTASQEEYIAASKFISELDIEKSKIFLIPGNHDINESENTKNWAIKYGNEEVVEKWEIIEKYNPFKEFYKTFYGDKEFVLDKLITDKLINDEVKTIIYFVNSCSKCYAFDKNYNGMGYIDTVNLQKEYNEEIKKNPKYKDYIKFICFHQNITINYIEDKNSGFDNQNKKNIEDFLLNNEFKGVLNGHEHTGDSVSLNNLIHLSVDSLFKSNVDYCGFNNYTITNENEVIKLIRQKNHLHLNKKRNFENTNFSHSDSKEETLRTPNAESSNSVLNTTEEKQDEAKLTPIIKETKYNELSKYSEKLIEYVKELNIVKTGHFHWSDKSRAHNWIDIPQLLNKKKYLDNIQNWVLNIKNENQIEPDLILALGLEGNIISAKLSFENDIPFTYLPYSYRYDDHTKLEKELKIDENTISKIKNILIITDVVHDGTTIKKIGSNENENPCVKKLYESSKIEKIYIISMFYTGSNFDRFCMNEKDENQNYKSKKYELYPISKINIIPCPYDNEEENGDFWKTDCDIYCQKLDKIYKFYNEK